MNTESPRRAPSRRAKSQVVTGIFAALILAGCGDSATTAPLVPDAPLLSAAESALTLHSGEAARTYFCSTSRRVAAAQPGENAGYHYGLIRLRYTEREYASEANGKETRFLVYVRDGAGEVEWAAWCHVPASPGSVQRALVRLGLQGHVRHVPGPDMRQSPHRGDQDVDDGDSGTSSTLVDEPANDEQCQEKWGEDAYWEPELQTCLIDLGGISSGGSGSESPPPPDDDEDYDWGPEPDPGDPDDGGGTGDGDGTPLEPPSPEDEEEPCRTLNKVINGLDLTAGLYTVWINSNPDATMMERQEVGGWVMEQNGSYHVDLWPEAGNVCGMNIDPPLPPFWLGQIVGFIHSHPYRPGETVPVCDDDGNPTDEWVPFQSGPTHEDMMASWELGTLVEHPNQPFPLPGYILDGAVIIEFVGNTVADVVDRCGY